MLALRFLLAALPAVFALPTPSDDGTTVPGKYIVILKDNVDAMAVSTHVSWAMKLHKRSLARRNEQGVDKVWNENFKGYSGEFDDQTIKEIENSDDVVAVEPVQVIETYQEEYVVQYDAPWGLGSISHRDTQWDEYRYDSSAGEGTWAYILDTGVYVEHNDFEGRAHLGYNAYPDSAFVDTQGHGTHCAGTIAGKIHGVAKKAEIIAVKVFGDGGSTTDIVLDGFEWAISNITNTPGRLGRSVVSMSLGGGRSEALNSAVRNAYNSIGVLSVVAAGNNGIDAQNSSPASELTALTVGAVDIDNVKASFSNFGSVVDIFAAGVGIASTFIGGPDQTAALSGTSMACPHVSGLALYLMGKDGVNSPGDVVARIKELGTAGVVTMEGAGSPNLLAYNGIEMSYPDPENY